MLLYYKGWKKYNEIQLTKNFMDLNNRKMKKSLSNLNTILINIIWYYFTRYGKGTIKFNLEKNKWT